MKKAVTLVAEAKKQQEESLLMNYQTWAKQIASSISEDGYYENEYVNQDKTFSYQRPFLRYLRRIGFKVTLLDIKHKWRNWYGLEFEVELDNTDYKEDLY
jgi:hypothetical protein